MCWPKFFKVSPILAFNILRGETHWRKPFAAVGSWEQGASCTMVSLRSEASSPLKLPAAKDSLAKVKAKGRDKKGSKDMGLVKTQVSLFCDPTHHFSFTGFYHSSCC